MATPDFTWEGKSISRLEAVKRAFRLFVEGDKQPGEHALLEGRPNDLVGLVTFARWPQTSCPLTLSHSVLLRLLDAEKPRSTPTESETNIGDAIAWGLVRLEKTNAKRKVMILGGGPNRIGQGIEFDYCCCQAAFALKEAGYEQTYDVDEIITRMPTPDETRRLSLPSGTPVAEHIRTGYTNHDQPVRVMLSIVPGDSLILRYVIPT